MIADILAKAAVIASLPFRVNNDAWLQPCLGQ